MREMKKEAYRSELGEHSDRQDGNDRQQGAKLRALPFVSNENSHGALHRGRVSSAAWKVDVRARSVGSGIGIPDGTSAAFIRAK